MWNYGKSPGNAALTQAGIGALRPDLPVRYIKLGEGGKWADKAIASQTVPFWYRAIDHNICAAGDWEAVRDQLVKMGRSKSGVGHGLRELRDYYELDDCLWVTFANGFLWWALGSGTVVRCRESADDQPARYRNTVDGWHNTDVHGHELRQADLSTSLTKVSAFRMTLCSIEREGYLLRKLRGEEEPLYVEAQDLLARQVSVAARMIAQLDWSEFEILVDLIFARGGWQRLSAVGGTQADIDLEVSSPVTGESAWVQVKSSANQSVLDDYVERYCRSSKADRLFFVCHSFKGALRPPDDPRITLWLGDELARRALDAGLFDWLAKRVR